MPCSARRGHRLVPAIKPAVIFDEMLRRHFDAPRGDALSEETREASPNCCAAPGSPTRVARCAPSRAGRRDSVATISPRACCSHRGCMTCTATRRARTGWTSPGRCSSWRCCTRATSRPQRQRCRRCGTRKSPPRGVDRGRVQPSDPPRRAGARALASAAASALGGRRMPGGRQGALDRHRLAGAGRTAGAAGEALPYAARVAARGASRRAERRLAALAGWPGLRHRMRRSGRSPTCWTAAGRQRRATGKNPPPGSEMLARDSQHRAMRFRANRRPGRRHPRADGIDAARRRCGLDEGISLPEKARASIRRSMKDQLGQSPVVGAVAFALADRDAAATERSPSAWRRSPPVFPGTKASTARVRWLGASGLGVPGQRRGGGRACRRAGGANRCRHAKARGYAAPECRGLVSTGLGAQGQRRGGHRGCRRAGSADRCPFPGNEDIQLENAVAWRLLAWAHRNSDASATRQAAERVARIAASLPRHDGIQFESAVAWRFLAAAHCDSDPAATEEAVERVAQIAAGFPRHERIQHESAQAWRALAWAHHKSDAAATGRAADRLARIAAGFPRHEGIQFESAHAWNVLARAHGNSNATATARAVKRVLRIAADFPAHPGIQLECAQAWRLLAWTHKDSDAAATERAAERVSQIAAGFPEHGDIQRAHAHAWGSLAWAYRESDTTATERAAERVSQIAAGFAGHEDIQFEAAQAWRVLAWAHKATDAVATARAAERVAQIAARFPAHEGIQHESVQAWRSLAQAHRTATRPPAGGPLSARGGWPLVFPSTRTCSMKAPSPGEPSWKRPWFDDPTAVARGMSALDALAGMDPQSRVLPAWSGRRAFGTVLQERAAAQATVARWRALRSGGTGAS